MSLIKCADCGTAHSKEAKACPKCGKPNSKAQYQKNLAASIAIVIVAFLSAILVLDYMAYKSAGGGVFFNWLNR